MPRLTRTDRTTAIVTTPEAATSHDLEVNHPQAHPHNDSRRPGATRGAAPGARREAHAGAAGQGVQGAARSERLDHRRPRRAARLPRHRAVAARLLRERRRPRRIRDEPARLRRFGLDAVHAWHVHAHVLGRSAGRGGARVPCAGVYGVDRVSARSGVSGRVGVHARSAGRVVRSRLLTLVVAVGHVGELLQRFVEEELGGLIQSDPNYSSGKA